MRRLGVVDAVVCRGDVGMAVLVDAPGVVSRCE